MGPASIDDRRFVSLKNVKMTKLRIRQVKSTIGQRKHFGRTLRSLGLRRINHSVVQEDTPSIRGMVHSVRHLVSVEAETDEEE